MRAVVNGIFYLLRTGCQWRFTLGLPIASWVAPAKLSGKRGAKRLIAGLGSLWVTIRTVIADGGHKSTKGSRPRSNAARDGSWSSSNGVRAPSKSPD